MAASGGEWLAKFLYEQGLRGDDLKRMWAIGMRESGGRPNIDNAGTNRDGSIDYGLFQINGSAHGARIKEKFGWSMDDLRDPVKNFTVMRWMSNDGKDLSAWGVANPDGSVTGWAANIGDAQRAKFTNAMNAQMSRFDGVAKKAGLGDVGGASMTVTADGTPKPDPLSKKELAGEYGFAWRVIKNTPDLWNLFQTAFNDKTGQWDPKKFALAVKETDWYKNNAEFTRDAWIAEQQGGADWKAQLEEAGLYVKAAADSYGVTLSPDQQAQLAHRYIFEGWGLQARKPLMQQEIGALVGKDGAALGGNAVSVAEGLKKIALNNGLSYDDAYYTDATRQIAMGLKTDKEIEAAIREEAASKWPTYADQIRAGSDARTLASSYINTYAKVMEKDPNSISLDDPTLRSAMTGVDDKGNFRPLGLWEFEQTLRKRDDWMDTKNGQDTTVSAGVGVLRRMGFLGN
jgi:hypothetical protein